MGRKVPDKSNKMVTGDPYKGIKKTDILKVIIF